MAVFQLLGSLIHFRSFWVQFPGHVSLPRVYTYAIKLDQWKIKNGHVNIHMAKSQRKKVAGLKD